jgi:hypothetical protein
MGTKKVTISAKTGRFVPASEAKKHPANTVTMTVHTKSKKK